MVGETTLIPPYFEWFEVFWLSGKLPVISHSGGRTAAADQLLCLVHSTVMQKPTNTEILEEKTGNSEISQPRHFMK